MLKLWGRANSINVQKALYCIEELALQYERIDAGRGYGIVDTPEYRAMNPNSLVPTLEDAGYTDEAILAHLRGPGPHVRGCWLVDSILGKS